MRSFLSILLFSLVLTVSAAAEVRAQTPVPSPIPPTTKLAFDHDRINTDRYELIVDSQTPQNLGLLTPVTGQTFEIPFPPLTPGQHVLIVRACNISGCAASTPFPVSVIVQPTPPGSLRIVMPPS